MACPFTEAFINAVYPCRDSRRLASHAPALVSRRIASVSPLYAARIRRIPGTVSGFDLGPCQQQAFQHPGISARCGRYQRCGASVIFGFHIGSRFKE